MTRLLPLLGFALLALTLALGLAQRQSAEPPPSPLIGQQFPSFSLPKPDNSGSFTNADLRGPALINLYASWCIPCQAEHPLLLQLAAQHISVYGIAWRDKPENIQALLAKQGNPYAANGIDENGALTVALGLTGVPESYVIDSAGRIIFKQSGPLTEELLHAKLLPLLRPTEAGNAP